MVSDNQTLNKVYTAKNSEELMDAYKDWAGNYDADTVGAFGYVAHIASAEALDEVLGDTKACILDAGCGTGWVKSSSRRDIPGWTRWIIPGRCSRKPSARKSTIGICRLI